MKSLSPKFFSKNQNWLLNSRAMSSCWCDMSWYVMTCHDMSWYRNDMSWHVMTFCDISWYFVTFSWHVVIFSWHVTLYHDMSRHIMTYHDMSWHIMTCHENIIKYHVTYHDMSWYKPWEKTKNENFRPKHVMTCLMICHDISRDMSWHDINVWKKKSKWHDMSLIIMILLALNNLDTQKNRVFFVLNFLHTLTMGSTMRDFPLVFFGVGNYIHALTKRGHKLQIESKVFSKNIRANLQTRFLKSIIWS